MAKETITIKSLFGGISPSSVIGPEGFYHEAYNIDPFLPSIAQTNFVKSDPILRPGQPYTLFSGTELTDNLWHIIVPHTKITNQFVIYITGAKIHLSTVGFVMQTADEATTPNTFPRAVTSLGRGAEFYDPGGTSTDYVFYKNGTQVGTYGPVSVAASCDFQDNWKTGLYDGDSPMYWHLWDNYFYIGNGTAGAGTIDAIKGNTSSSWATTPTAGEYESTVLRLPKGFIITDLDSYGSKLLISGHQTTDTVMKQGVSGVFVWDTLSPFWDKFIPYPDGKVTAIQKVNGVPYVFSGGTDTRISILDVERGNYQDVEFLPKKTPPHHGSTDASGELLVWAPGTQGEETLVAPESTSIDTYASIYGYGRLHPKLTKGLHNIARAPIAVADAGSNSRITGIKFLQHINTAIAPRIVFGFRNNAGSNSYGIVRMSTGAAHTAIYRAPRITRTKPFKINKITYNFTKSVSSSTSTITPKVFTDSFASSETQAVINDTNYSGLFRVVQFPTIVANTDMCLELEWGGSGVTPLEIMLPIEIEIEDVENP